MVPDTPGYHCGRRIGGGPTSDVYVATDSRGQTVAVKCLKESSSCDARSVMLIRREARAGFAVRHDHLVRLFDSHVAQKPYFLTMEYIPGESVKKRLLETGAYSLPIALGIVRQVAEALTALHRDGLIHGDVKPANVLLPMPGRAKLIDLGFCHSSGELQPWIEKGHVIGTANYLAPEMAKLPPHDSTAADMFSLGVMLYEMLTGELPYPGQSIQDVVRERRKCQPAQLPADAGPETVARLVARMTDPNFESRPPAHTLVAELISLQIATLGRRAAA
ncbi:MAG: serine/threonine-protein kinase [Gemmataceae bacterium]